MNKKITVCISIILGIFLLGAAAGYAVISRTSLSVSTGLCLFSDNKSCFIIKNNTPVKLTAPDGNSEIFSEFSDGDKLLVFHSGINETYPASTSAYLCIKLKDGEKENIPEEVMSSLTYLGWLGSNSQNNTDTVFTKEVSIEREYGNISFKLPDGWSYTENKNTEKPHLISIDIFKETSSECKITIAYTDSFGVCGTGLTSQEITLSAYKASKGIYDNNPYWDYIVLKNTPGYYVIYNHMSAEEYKNVSGETDNILSTLTIADGMVFKEEALSQAQEYSSGEYKSAPGEFDTENGIWTFTFKNDETEEIIKINSTGEIVTP